MRTSLLVVSASVSGFALYAVGCADDSEARTDGTGGLAIGGAAGSSTGGAAGTAGTGGASGKGGAAGAVGGAAGTAGGAGAGGGAGAAGDGGSAGTAGTGGAASCGTTPSGGTESRLCYTSATVPEGSSCSSSTQTRTCNNGSWLPDYPACAYLSCSDGNGKLLVGIYGLAAGTNASVQVAGPNAYSASLSASQTLTGLAAGTYTISASNVGASLVTPSTQTVTVVAGEKAKAYVAHGTAIVNVKSAPYNAKGDGTTDDTTAIQNAVDAAPSGAVVLVPNGTYMIDAIRNNTRYGVILGSDMIVYLSPQAELKAIPNASEISGIAIARYSTNLSVIGTGKFLGDRTGHTGTGGEFGFGLWIFGAHHMVVDGVTARECWGDGFYITGNATITDSQDVSLLNVLSEHNRRQGLSIEQANGVLVKDSVFRNTGDYLKGDGTVNKGTLPECGIDIEPFSDETSNNIHIVGCTIVNNAGGGISTSTPMSQTGVVTNIVIEGNTITGNGVGAVDNATDKFGIQFSNTKIAGSRIINNLIKDNTGRGVLLRDDASGFTISGNTISGSTLHGLLLSSVDGNTVTNNTITANTLNGVRIRYSSNNTITGNTITNNGYGIYSPDSTSTNNTISGNTLSGNGTTP